MKKLTLIGIPMACGAFLYVILKTIYGHPFWMALLSGALIGITIAIINIITKAE